MDDTLKVKHIYLELLERIQNGDPCAVATVTGTIGSTPQKPGSSAIIGNEGIVAGTVGGGVVELKTEKAGVEAMHSKQTGYYRFDLDHDISDEEAAICGGGMRIFLDATPEKHISVFQSVKEAAFDRVPGVLVTFCNIPSGSDCNIDRLWLTKNNFQGVDENLPNEVAVIAETMLANPNPDEFREITLKDEENEKQLVFLESIVPLPRLIIAGAGHVGKALSHLGKLLDFEVTVWDDRTELANKKYLPDVQRILTGNLEESLGEITVDCDTFIVIVTRGHKNDADVLRMFIGSNARYIGMIGSRKKVAQVRESFLKNGWTTTEQWEKIHAPVGLEIHSKTVQEIAVSIAAQLVMVRNQLKKVNE
jgi:xanthine dehydrogenase accessory factor